jgi:hypothetical protein
MFAAIISFIPDSVEAGGKGRRWEWSFHLPA